MLAAKSIRTMTIGAVQTLISACKIILGEEVLSYLECEYSELRQRNYRRTKGWESGLINTLISYGFLGGNYIFYERQDGSIIVVDARSRLRGLSSIISGSNSMDMSKLENGAQPWYIKAGCSNIEWFTDLPEWAKNNVLNSPIQVIWLSHRDTTFEEAREIFCAVNHGVQKVSRVESYDNKFKGAMTQTIGEMTSHEFFTSTGIFSDADFKNRKANDALAFLYLQENSGHFHGRKGIEQMYLAFRCMNSNHINGVKEAIEHLTTRLALVVDVDSSARIKTCGFLLPLSWVLKHIEDLGINVKSKAKRIRDTLEEFSIEMGNYEGSNELERKLSRSKLERQNAWHASGHDVDGHAVKIKRAKLLRDNVLKGCFTEEERKLIPADIS